LAFASSFLPSTCNTRILGIQVPLMYSTIIQESLLWYT
jgi:hypothetical protein